MKSEKIQDAIGEVRDEFIVDAEAIIERKEDHSWMKWLAMAAGILIAVVGTWAVIHPIITKETESQTNNDTQTTANQAENSEQVGCFITIDGDKTLLYAPIGALEGGHFDLLPQSEGGFKATEDDLGQKRGVVTSCQDESLVGKTVYGYAAYPDNKAICILDNDGTYEFYYSYGKDIILSAGDLADIVFKTNHLPEKCVFLDVEDKYQDLLYRVDDAETIREICGLFSGYECIDLAASEEVFLKAWQEKGGNDDLHLEDGKILFRTTDAYNSAQEIWTKGERILDFENTEGFRVTVDYFPAVGIFQSYNGYFIIPKETVSRINDILNIIDE